MITNFQFYTSTRVFFGKGVENKAGELIKASGAHKVLLHYGGHSAEKSGLLAKVCKNLDEAGLAYIKLGGVVPNPRLGKVHEGIELCKTQHVDFILAVGGGSVIDSAKAIAIGSKYAGEVWDLYEGKAVCTEAIPLGCVLTISATGSEMSSSTVITNEKGWLKRGMNSDAVRCRFSLLNPELTYGLPKYQTASGGVDIIMHTLERYFAKGETLELTDSIGEALIRTVIKYLPLALANPQDYKARAEIMWAGTVSHNDMTGDRTNGDWAAHQLEHELGGMFDIAHGAGLAAIWGSWARYVLPTNPARFAGLAEHVFGIKPQKDVQKTALMGIEAMEKFFQSVGMPICLGDMQLHLSDEEIKTLAYKATFMGKRTVGGFKVLQAEDMEAIYKAANNHEA
jgi:alcohol dehydrogenase YqhD (iron-dependent ADH family)